LIIDALIGYGLSGPPNDPVAASIESTNHSRAPILSLDIPSGMNATTGETPGVAINPIRTLTLALPKSGLSNPVAGELILGDIGIPKEVFEEIGIQIPSLFEHGYRVPLERV
ncbi:MAG: NAD(P)H-hydrate epimerase, partial [Anaerolineae bacterium]|nr:NAD(P)H-hydrate epimerase [Anaerolineae bacterium]